MAASAASRSCRSRGAQTAATVPRVRGTRPGPHRAGGTGSAAQAGCTPWRRRTERAFPPHRVELGERGPRVGAVGQAPEPRDEAIEPRRQEDQVAARLRHPVGVRRAGGHEDRGPRRGVDLPIREPEAQRSLQHVPRFVVGSVDVQVGGTGVRPLAHHQRCPGRGDRRAARPGDDRPRRRSVAVTRHPPLPSLRSQIRLPRSSDAGTSSSRASRGLLPSVPAQSCRVRQLALAPGDELAQRLLDARVERRGDVAVQRLPGRLRPRASRRPSRRRPATARSCCCRTARA